MQIVSTIYCRHRGELAMITSGSTFADIRGWVGQYDEIVARVIFKGKERQVRVRRGVVRPRVIREAPSLSFIAEPIMPTPIIVYGPPPPWLN